DGDPITASFENLSGIRKGFFVLSGELMRLPFLLYSIPITIGCLLLGLCSFSQNLLAPDQPEQDACNALYLCGGKFSSPYSYQQTGKIIDLGTTSCGGGEDNSMW